MMSAADYQNLYHQSITDPVNFWAEQSKKYITWFAPWQKVLEGEFAHGDIAWYAGGKLNAAFNCLDRHLPTHAEKIALIWQGDEPNETVTYTYAALHSAVCRLATVLTQYGIKKGDHICIYLPMIPEAVIAMLACARIGAVHSVVFAGFSASALKARLEDADCRLVITANVGLRGGKVVPLKSNVDEALFDLTTVKHVLVVQRTKDQVAWQKDRDYWYHEAVQHAAETIDAVSMDALDPFFILYTSGSTGKPKGIVHATGGYLVYAAMTQKLIFDYHEDEIFWCTADVGWITGHTYTVYGPLLNGGTTLIYEGTPNYPTPARFYEVIDQHRVNIFYTAPTAIRALRREGDEWVKQTSRESLRILGSVGEPINPPAWQWYYDVIGDSRCPIVDTWWQTETGGIMISALPYATPLKPGAASWPFFGVLPDIVDDDGQPVADGTLGNLVIKQPWPGIMQTILHDKERFVETYFKPVAGCYATGDQAHRDADGYYWIAGRSDDIIKVAGHRIGTEEVESALLKHCAIVEAAVVPIEDAIKGQAIYAFVTPAANVQPSRELEKELINIVRKDIGPIATISQIQWADSLPKTRSGKIMRRLLRKIANQDLAHLGDISTLADPSVVDALIKGFKTIFLK